MNRNIHSGISNGHSNTPTKILSHINNRIQLTTNMGQYNNFSLHSIEVSTCMKF